MMIGPCHYCLIHAKSAHVYEPEWELMTRLTGGHAAAGTRSPR